MCALFLLLAVALVPLVALEPPNDMVTWAAEQSTRSSMAKHMFVGTYGPNYLSMPVEPGDCEWMDCAGQCKCLCSPRQCDVEYMCYCKPKPKEFVIVRVYKDQKCLLRANRY